MENKDNEETIEIRRCDLHSIFALLSLGNNKTVEAAWNSAECMMKKAKKK